MKQRLDLEAIKKQVRDINSEEKSSEKEGIRLQTKSGEWKKIEKIHLDKIEEKNMYKESKSARALTKRGYYMIFSTLIAGGILIGINSLNSLERKIISTQTLERENFLLEKKLKVLEKETYKIERDNLPSISFEINQGEFQGIYLKERNREKILLRDYLKIELNNISNPNLRDLKKELILKDIAKEIISKYPERALLLGIYLKEN